jgi:hypothetical protein
MADNSAYITISLKSEVWSPNEKEWNITSKVWSPKSEVRSLMSEDTSRFPYKS